MRTPRWIRRAALGACLATVLGAPLPAWAQAPQTEYEGAAALGLALRRLGTTKRVLMVGAHPDDESTQILSTLALGDGAQVAYLSLTRGEGGQNGIGPELQEGLGLIRSEELLAARRLDGARQFFTRAYDFGFSKDADEAFRHWPRDSLLADVVATVRHFRPDLIVSIFSGTPRDGHGQHQAAGILAREAFQAAADPARFPEQIARGLRPHATPKLYQALWRDQQGDYRLETGELDPLLGRSHYQVAMASRSRHRSQDMGQILTPGPRASAFRLIETRAPQAGNGSAGADLFAGVDTLLSSRADVARAAELLRRYEARVAEVRAGFNPLHAGDAVPGLTEALGLLSQAAAVLPPQADTRDVLFRIGVEAEEVNDALWRAAGLRLDAVASDEAVVPGQTMELTLSLWNGGTLPVQIDALGPRLPEGWRAEATGAAPGVLAPGELVSRTFRVTIPADAAPSEPYFLRAPRDGDLYRWPAEAMPYGVPFDAAPLAGAALVRVGGATAASTADATFQALDKMQGELRRPVRVVPAVSVVLEPQLAVLPLGGEQRTREFTVRLRAEAVGGVDGRLVPRLPMGWRAEPAEVPLRFAREGEERTATFRVTPPATLDAGAFPVAVEFVTGEGRRFDRGYQLIDYPHIRPHPLYRPAAATLRALDVRVPQGLRVGYVAGPGDEVPAALRQLGVAVESLGPAELATADLSAYDVIVTGIRAYEVRPDLVAHNQRLLDYVRAGGTAIVQYNKYEYTEPGIAPFPVQIARPHGRVTDETAPVTLLDPAHPLLTTPNRITDADFEGWVQERGLYFLSVWGDPFTPLLAMADPGEEPLRGSLLIAPYGEGTYVYTGLAFFRQLPAGVPGAYRLFANLLALGAK